MSYIIWYNCVHSTGSGLKHQIEHVSSCSRGVYLVIWRVFSNPSISTLTWRRSEQQWKKFNRNITYGGTSTAKIIMKKKNQTHIHRSRLILNSRKVVHWSFRETVWTIAHGLIKGVWWIFLNPIYYKVTSHHILLKRLQVDFCKNKKNK